MRVKIFGEYGTKKLENAINDWFKLQEKTDNPFKVIEIKQRSFNQNGAECSIISIFYQGGKDE